MGVGDGYGNAIVMQTRDIVVFKLPNFTPRTHPSCLHSYNTSCRNFSLFQPLDKPNLFFRPAYSLLFCLFYGSTDPDYPNHDWLSMDFLDEGQCCPDESVMLAGTADDAG